ncbi:MAG: hypothetical protein LBS74_08035 [Oscillospiraceae bacterium]|jgi:hypothetical protein|nr:hypothetical protein [Oscillospiraceae bacterium]
MKKIIAVVLAVSVCLSGFIILNLFGVFAKKSDISFAAKCTFLVKGMDENGAIRTYSYILSEAELTTLKAAVSGNRIFKESPSNCYEYYCLVFTGEKKAFTLWVEDTGMSTMKCDGGYILLDETDKKKLYSVIYPYF